MTATNDPDEIRADIERTRAELSDNVDALADTANPKNMARRQAGRVKQAAVGVKEHIMGSSDDPYDSGRVGDAKDRAADAKYALQDKAPTPSTHSRTRPRPWAMRSATRRLR